MASFVKDLLSVGFSKIIMVVASLVTSIVVARTLGPEKNGIIASLLVIPSLFISISSLGIRQSTTFFLGKKIIDEDLLLKAVFQLWFFTFTFSVTVSFFLLRYFTKSSDNLLYILLVLVPIPLVLFNDYISGVYLGKNMISEFNKINWIPNFILMLFTIILLVVFDFGISGFLLASILGPIFISCFFFLKNSFFKRFSFDINFKIIKILISKGSIFAIALLIINLNYKLDIVLLDFLSTPYEIGIYSKGAAISQYLWEIPMVMSSIIFARSAISKDGFVFSKKIIILLRLSFYLILFASVILFIFSNFIITLFYGDSFLASSMTMKILLPGVLFFTIFKVMNVDLAGKGKPQVSLKAMLPGLIINIVLNLILIPNYGSNGAAAASCISYSFASILFLHFYSKEVKIPISDIIKFDKKDFKYLKLKNSKK